MNAQRTVSREGRIEGVGLHTGRPSAVTVRPAPENAGFRFSKDGRPVDSTKAGGRRCTEIGEGRNAVQTVEHFLAALSGLGVTNAEIGIDGDELPALDGSALGYAQFLKGLGLSDQRSPRRVYAVTEPLFVHEGMAAIAVYPSERASYSYVLDYPHPALRAQKVEYEPSPEAFVRDLAPARTFCTEKEADEIRAQGLGLGADLRANALVIGERGPVGNTFRLPDECARHKLLDLVGDLALFGAEVRGRFVALRSGHALNRKLVEELKHRREEGS